MHPQTFRSQECSHLTLILPGDLLGAIEYVSQFSAARHAVARLP